MVNAIYQHNYIIENVIPVRPRINSIGTETLSWSPIQTMLTLSFPTKKERDKTNGLSFPPPHFKRPLAEPI